MFDDILYQLQDWFYSILYKLQAGICYLIDFIKSIFHKLCGLDMVIVDGERKDLVTSLVTSSVIQQVFLTIFLVGVILLTIFLIIALIRANYLGNEKKGRGIILSKAGHSFLLFLLIPFLLVAGMMLVNTIMASINMSMQQHLTSEQQLIGGQMLITTGDGAYIGNPEAKAEIEKLFVSGQLDYNNLNDVRKYYDIWRMNYLIGLLGGIVILVMFVLSSLTFIQRIFDITLLYIIAPISISTIPLDDGTRFKLWKDMLISKVLSAYGIIIVMNLFFLIIPQITKMTFFNNSFQNGIVYVLFLIGGAFAVTKANLLISQLTGSQAGGREFAQMMYNIRSGIAFSRATTGAVGALMGKAIGGNDYLKSRKQGNSRGESLNVTIHSNRNQRVVQENAKKNHVKQVAAMPVRLASMPIGTVKDLMSGGLITAGKNFMPRLKNAFGGDTVINHADIKAKATSIGKANSTRQQNEAGGKDEANT